MLVSFPSGELALRGVLHKPSGAGPFPAMVWNHGSERAPGPNPELARFYTEAGYVLFGPHRRGHGGSPGEHLTEAVRAEASADRGEAIGLIIELHHLHLEDTVAAIEWLAKQPEVDPTRIAMSGVSHGGIQTLLAAEGDVGAKAYIPFAPAAVAWRGNPELHERLLRAVRKARAPIFLLQAENDYDLGPSEVLGAELRRKGGPNRARMYPRYGDTAQSGHGEFAWRGTDVWGRDVCAFLDQALERPAP